MKSTTENRFIALGSTYKQYNELIILAFQFKLIQYFKFPQGAAIGQCFPPDLLLGLENICLIQDY